MIKIKKISAIKNPSFPTIEWENHVPGQINNGYSLPVEYEVMGEWIDKPEVGKSCRLHRFFRNGVEAEGLFQTSQITKVLGNWFWTQNSVYFFQEIYQMNFKTNIKSCARCGGDHNDLEFSKFTVYCKEWSYWALCPTLKEPILLKISEEN